MPKVYKEMFQNHGVKIVADSSSKNCTKQLVNVVK